MSKLLYGIGVLAILFSGVPFVLCGMQWRCVPPGAGDAPEVSILERSHVCGGLDGDAHRDTVSPLVAQATAFALYLNPPPPSAPPQAPGPAVNLPSPPPRPALVIPKFRLLSTSCYSSSPEKSLALVAEPGKGMHWVGKGDRLGHLVVESITDGGIVYRDGARLHEAAVAMKDRAPLAQLKPSLSAAARGAGAEVRSVNAALLSRRGAGISDLQPAAGEGLD